MLLMIAACREQPTEDNSVTPTTESVQIESTTSTDTTSTTEANEEVQTVPTVDDNILNDGIIETTQPPQATPQETEPQESAPVETTPSTDTEPGEEPEDPSVSDDGMGWG